MRRFRSSITIFSAVASAASLLGQHATNTADVASKFQLAPGFALKVWAMEPQLSNGVAFHIDPKGRAWIAESHRWARSIFDITQKTNWLLNDLSFRNVPERSAFLESQFDAIDPEFLTRDSEIVRLVEDRDGDGVADHSSVHATGFNTAADGTAAGVLATRDTVYFANIPNLWKLSIPSTPGETPKRESLANGFGVHVGVSGHDLHGLIFGPDGRLYMSFGDRGAHITNREGRVIDLPDMGAVLRCEPDGRNLEVFCVGLRNPQELAFDDDGNLWTVDNDTAGADPCRVLHLVEDGDYGWRASYQHHEGFGPWVQEELWKGGQDNILPLAGTVSQGPSGLAFYPGTGFGPLLKDTFLHCDFPAGIWSYTVKPRGASYEVASKSKFLWNCWSTDVDFGPDGAVYVLDWVAGWGQPMKGRIHRITPSTPPTASDLALSTEVRSILAQGVADQPSGKLRTLLAHPDRRVRLEAQFELARRGMSELTALTQLALGTNPSLARRHALWAIGQIVRANPAADVRSQLARLLPLLESEDAKVQAVTARLLGEAGVAEAETALARLATESPEPAVRFAGAMGLGSLVRPGLRPNADATRKVVVANAGADPFLTHAAVRHWVRLEREFRATATSPAGKLTPALGAMTRDADPNVRLAAVLTLRNLRYPFLTNLLSDSDPRVVIAAGRAIHDAPVVFGMPALASLLTRVDCPPAILSRSIDAAFRLGTAQHAQTLAALAKRRDPSPQIRALALRALGDWPKPPALDRVNGLWRPTVTLGRSDPGPAEPTAPGNPLLEKAAAANPSVRSTPLAVLPDDLGRSTPYDVAMALKRNPEPARRAFLRVADEILNPSTPDEYGQVIPGGPAPVEVQLAVIDTAAALRTKEAAQPLFEKFSQTNTPAAVRRAIVPFLAGINAIQAPDAVRMALADGDNALRAVALPHLDKLDPATALPVLKPLLQAGTPLSVNQAAYAALAKLSNADADALLLSAFQELLSGKLRPELHLDVLSAAEARQAASTPLKVARDQWLSQNPTNDPIASRAAVLKGGDAVRGGVLFKNHPQVQCLRCHKVGGDGGTVGPTLDGIGKLRDRTYLLEALVYPNKAYAEGFKPAEGGLSAMPEGLADLLTPIELRDIIEFLSTLR
jgi:quinoprotein glucose dehydrogenase